MLARVWQCQDCCNIRNSLIYASITPQLPSHYNPILLHTLGLAIDGLGALFPATVGMAATCT